MPIINDPSRQIGIMIPYIQNQIAKDRQEGAYDGITNEVVAAVNADGSYTVRGQQLQLTTTGVSSPIGVGDIVKVGWRAGVAQAILSHTARRIKPGPPPPLSGPIVEMLLAAPTSSSDTRHDIYFRNANQTTFLNCRAKLATAGIAVSAIFPHIDLVPNSWGLDHRHFVVTFVTTDNSPHVAIFALSGDETTAITQTAVARFTKDYDLGASTIGLGTITWDQNVGGGGHTSTAVTLGTLLKTGYSIPNSNPPFPIIQTAFGGITQAVYTRNNQLILGIGMSMTNFGAGRTSGPWYYPYIINVTTGVVLFNGIASQSIWPVSNMYDGAHFINAGAGVYTGNQGEGGVSLYMTPSLRGNFLRIIAAQRRYVFNTGETAVWLGAANLAASTTLSNIYPVTEIGVINTRHIWVISFNQRYVMWALASPGSFGGGGALAPPFSSTLAGYNFDAGLHITDLGGDENTFSVIDAIPLTTQADILSFMDDLPILVRPSLMWEDHNDLLVTVAPTGPNTRKAPDFVTFSHSSGGGSVVNVPFILPLKRLSTISQDLSTLKAIPPALQYVVNFIIAGSQVSGHHDQIVMNSSFSSPLNIAVQAIPGAGVALPTR